MKRMRLTKRRPPKRSGGIPNQRPDSMRLGREKAEGTLEDDMLEEKRIGRAEKRRARVGARNNDWAFWGGMR